MPKIQVHEKALAHLSRGLYRSPASAIRELVSNAWDANAATVRITTNYPNFFQIAIEDDGDGFDKQGFERLMAGGIGNSEKRPTKHSLKYDRPLIGRLGIGMLGIAQICGSFTITSKTKGGRGFRARVTLYDVLKERLDKNDPEVVKSDGGKEVDVGVYEFESNFDPTSARAGTTILTDDVHPTFVRAFQQSLDSPKFEPPPSAWSKAIRVFSKVHTLQELGDYWRLLWELSASSPIPYASRRSLPESLIADDHARLESYKFRVIVDGLELRKPIELKGNEGGYTTKPIGEQHLTPYGKDLRFHGYIVVQEGSQLKPDELRGILVRIKDVAIGYYDPSMLDYRYNEGPRSRWLTGEIFVTEGLEDALNIDRDSFNRFHPQFRAVQDHVHQLLHKEIFPRVYKQIEVRSAARADRKRTTRSEHLSNVLAQVTEQRVSIRKPKHTEEEGGKSQVEIAPRGRGFEIRIPDEKEIPTKKSNRQLASAILALFEVAMKETDTKRKRDVFEKALLSLLSRW